MRSYWKCLILIGCAGVLLLCLLGCFHDEHLEAVIRDALKPPTDSDFASVTAANTAFGFNLLTTLRSEDPIANMFISPLSISIALTMTYNGAAGATERAMAEVLEIEGLDRYTVNRSNLALQEGLGNREPKVEIAIANSIWNRQGIAFNSDFLNQNRQFFGAEIASLDFSSPQAVPIINEWVGTNTNGKIEKIIQTIDPEIVMILINAIYFKGSWQEEFDKSKTREGVFHLSDGSEKQVPMMRREGGYPYLRSEKFEAANLPYGDGEVSMYIFLPNRDSNLDEFLDILNAEHWSNWLSQFSTARNIIMILPRFKLEYEAELNDTLKAMGMAIAFGKTADFSGIGRDLFISQVRHKAVVEVNEKGTEAAAATSVKVGVKSISPTFRVDRPFFFAIYDSTTETILFMGIVREPME